VPRLGKVFELVLASIHELDLRAGDEILDSARNAANASADDKPAATTTTTAGEAKPDSEVEATKPDFTAAFWRCYHDWR
jgi:hypothetical protein